MADGLVADVLESETIVDTDVHLSVPEEELAKYVNTPYDDWLRAPDIQLKSPEWDPTMGGKVESRNLLTPEQLREEVCDALHVDYPLLNVFRNLSRLSQTDAAVALMRGSNDLLLDRFLDEGDFLGLATVATQKPDLAAEELDRVADHKGIVGVFIPTTGPTPPLGDPEYDILYEAIQDHGLTPVYHGATNSGFDVGFPKYNQAFEKFFTAHINAHLWSQAMTLTSIIAHGVPEKFPDLDFVFLEAGIGWVPYMMFRLNKEAAMRRSEVPLLEKQPEEYIRERMYFASQPLGEPINGAHMQSLLDIVGTDSLLFASDYPHWDFDHPSELATHLRARFDAAERSKVLSENATEVFDLPI